MPKPSAFRSAKPIMLPADWLGHGHRAVGAEDHRAALGVGLDRGDLHTDVDALAGHEDVGEPMQRAGCDQQLAPDGVEIRDRRVDEPAELHRQQLTVRSELVEGRVSAVHLITPL